MPREGGRFVFWDLCLSPEMAEFHRSVIRMKDILAGYTTMVERRNILTGDEMSHLFNSSLFGRVELVSDIFYRFDTRKRLGPEFLGNERAFLEWHAFIRAAASKLEPSILAKLRYEDDGDRIAFDVRKVIGLAEKTQPHRS
jgi:hypothetical protein